jgi:hypothetical protein
MLRNPFSSATNQLDHLHCRQLRLLTLQLGFRERQPELQLNHRTQTTTTPGYYTTHINPPNMANETYCTPAGGRDSLPGLDNSLYCVTPNTLNTPSFTNMTTACCDTNALQKMGGCDYCILEQPTSWYNASGADNDEPAEGWRRCLSRQADVSRLTRRCAFLIAIFQTSRRVLLHGFFLLLLLEGGWFGGWLRWLGSRLSWAPSRLARAIKEERPLGIAYETQRLMFQGTGEVLTPHDLPHLRPQPQFGIVQDPSRLGWWLKQSFQHIPSLPRPNQMKLAHSFASVLRSSNEKGEHRCV